MIPSRRRRSGALLDDYISQLGLLVERRHTERALIAARDEAENAARFAKEAMLQAQAADQAKTRFLATMTHELRTPLNAIIGFSQVLQSAPAQAEVAGYAGYINEAGTQLLGMLNGVLDLARIEAGRLPLEDQQVTFEELLNSAIRPLRRSAEEKSVTLQCGRAVENAIRVDPARMAQALRNIVSNAIKFTPEGGTIAIDSDYVPGSDLRIVVRDTGSGIPSEEIERVLRPFGQIEDHLTRQNGGLGLGLPIARALCRLHGGDLTLASGEGAGTIVEIRLPANRVEPVPATGFA